MLSLVGAGCYRPTNDAHCAISCDPSGMSCPTGLVCGSDGFCHGQEGEVCGTGMIDAPLPVDTSGDGPDGPPDPAGDALVGDAPAGDAPAGDAPASCMYTWVPGGAVYRWIGNGTLMNGGWSSGGPNSSIQTSPADPNRFAGSTKAAFTITTLGLTNATPGLVFEIGLSSGTSSVQLEASFTVDTSGTLTIDLATLSPNAVLGTTSVTLALSEPIQIAIDGPNRTVSVVANGVAVLGPVVYSVAAGSISPVATLSANTLVTVDNLAVTSIAPCP